MSRIDDINVRLAEIETEKISCSNNLVASQTQYDNLRLEEKTLNQELNKLDAIQKQSKAAEYFLTKHKDMQYIGITNGETETIYGKPYVLCSKCNSFFEMFIGNDGVKDYILAICPDCHTEVDLTNIENN